MPVDTREQLDRVQRRQWMRNAEGYLDLIMAFDDRWPLDLVYRKRLADHAIDCLTRIREPKGHLSHILFLKGQACRAAERHHQAIDYLKQSLELDPENIHTLLAIAWCHKRVNRVDLAIRDMETAIEYDSACSIAHYNLACYAALVKDVQKSVEHLRIALEQEPKFRELVANESDFDAIRDDMRFNSTPGLMI